MKKDNKIISFNDAALKLERKQYIGSIKLTIIRLPIIDDIVLYRTTMEDGKKTTMILLGEAYKILKEEKVKEKSLEHLKFFHKSIFLDFYLSKRRKVYFRSSIKSDGILMYYINTSLSALAKKSSYFYK